MRNLARIQNYYNRLAAWDDWRKLEQVALAAGQADLVERYQPPEDAGWRKIDKAIAALRQALAATTPPAAAGRQISDFENRDNGGFDL
jgi:hypothetical protein